MEEGTYDNYDLLEDFLIEIYGIDQSEYEKIEDNNPSSLQIDIKKLSQELNPFWGYLYNNLIDFFDLKKQFLKTFKDWNKKYEGFLKSEGNEEFNKFISTYFSNWQKLSFQRNQISRREIEQIILQEKPKFSDSMSVEITPFLNLILYSSSKLDITLHLKLSKLSPDVYNLLFIFSIWRENTENYWKADFQDIKLRNRENLIGYEIFKYLEAKSFLIDFLKLEKEEDNLPPYMRVNQPTQKYEIHPSNNALFEIASYNPLTLCSRLKEIVQEVDELLINLIQNQDLDINEYVQNLSSELENFLDKGKLLFLKVQDLDKIDKGTTAIREDFSHREREDKKVKPNEILSFFKDIYEKDSSNEDISDEDKGYRSLNQTYDEYKENIDASKPTFYQYFKDYDLSSFLERRKKVGRGGSYEFRYTGSLSEKISLEQEKRKEESIIPDLVSVKVEVRTALRLYNNQNYDRAIDSFNFILRNKKAELKKLPEERLYIYYYIGRSYLKMENYDLALDYFTRAYELDDKRYNVGYNLMKAYYFNSNYLKASDLAGKIIEEIGDIFNEMRISPNLDYLYVNSLDPVEFRDIMPRAFEGDVLSKYLITINMDMGEILFDEYPFQTMDFSREEIDSINKNILSIRKLFEITYKIVYLKFEVLRKELFTSVLDNEKVRISEVLNYLNDFYHKIPSIKLIKDVFIQPEFDHFIYYARSLCEAFGYGDMTHDLPKIEYGTVFPNKYPANKQFFKHYRFLNTVNELFQLIFTDDTRTYQGYQLDKYEPYRYDLGSDLIAEHLFYQAYLNYKYSIDARLQREKERLKTEKFENNFNIKMLLQGVDNFYNVFRRDKNPSIYLEAARNAHIYCKKHDQKTMLKLTKQILSYTKDKYKEIEYFRFQRRKRQINQELEFLSKYYSKKEEIIELEFEEVFGESYDDFFYSRFKRAIRNKLEETKGEVKLIIKLFNPELNKDVMEKLNYDKIMRNYTDRNIKFPFLTEFEYDTTPEGLIRINVLNLVDFVKYHTAFDKRDNLKRILYSAIYLNLTKFKIQISKEDPDNFLAYLKNVFPDEYDNPFFNFTYESNSGLMTINLK